MKKRKKLYARASKIINLHHYQKQFGGFMALKTEKARTSMECLLRWKLQLSGTQPFVVGYIHGYIKLPACLDPVSAGFGELPSKQTLQRLSLFFDFGGHKSQLGGFPRFSSDAALNAFLCFSKYIEENHPNTNSRFF